MTPAPSSRELLALRFADCMGRLKHFGVICDVAVVAGAVIVATSDKGSAKTLRKAIKTAAGKCGANHCENRPRGRWIFTVTV